MGGTNIEGLGFFAKTFLPKYIRIITKNFKRFKEISYIISNQTDEQKFFLNIL